MRLQNSYVITSEPLTTFGYNAKIYPIIILYLNNIHPDIYERHQTFILNIGFPPKRGFMFNMFNFTSQLNYDFWHPVDIFVMISPSCCLGAVWACTKDSPTPTPRLPPPLNWSGPRGTFSRPSPSGTASCWGQFHLSYHFYHLGLEDITIRLKNVP